MFGGCLKGDTRTSAVELETTFDRIMQRVASALGRNLFLGRQPGLSLIVVTPRGQFATVPSHDFPFPDRCYQGQCSLASLSSRWEDEPPIDEPQDRFPAPHLEKDAFFSANSFLAPGTGLFPVSVPNALYIPDGRQTLVSPASDAPIADIFPGSREELQLPEVWTRIHTPPSMAVQIDANRYPADNTGTGVGSCGFQDSGSQALDESRCAPPPEPECQLHFDRGQVTLASSLPPTVQLNGPLVASSIPTSVPPSQGRIADTTERRETKTWCSLCKIGFSQSQVLGRHKKDKHELKESCSFCTSFKWSRGRPYLYKKHLRMRHFQNTPPNDRQKGSKAHEGNMKPQALAQNNSQANDVPPPRPPPAGDGLPHNTLTNTPASDGYIITAHNTSLSDRGRLFSENCMSAQEG
ncbi:hypothetical protein EDB84DRAFT_1444940 [Lactarius hengduanensis]|nr:hypothetical protein EDB84DRAFT_1444940 [Lactarius hengduanensis]